jgi:hypothetical protein
MNPDHRTEAECLLEQGTLYRKRVGLERPSAGHDPIFAGFKQAAFSLYFGDAPIYHFDLEGRWQRAFVDGVHYLKGLDTAVHAVERVREGPNLRLERRLLDHAEASDFDAEVRDVASAVVEGLDQGRFQRREPPAAKALPLESDELRGVLERIRRWDTPAWLAERARYEATYGRMPFLPPECQGAVVLQATLGDPRSRSFVLSPPDAALTRSPAEFAHHARDVLDLLGRRLFQCKLVFLAGNDVLHLPVSDVSAFLEAIGRIFPIQRGGFGDRPGSSPTGDPLFGIECVHVFVDDFTQPLPGREDWKAFCALGLVRLSLGVESGATEVRALYAKSWEDNSLRATVADLKSAGLGVSVLTLVGPGGVEHTEPHVRATVRLIESLELSSGDFVFLLDEREVCGPIEKNDASTALEASAWTEQQARLKNALAPMRSRGIKVLPYTIEKQWM